MSFVKIQSGQTDEIQHPPLYMLSQEMHLPWAPQFSTPVLHPLLWNISWYIDCEKASCWAKNAQLMVWYCDKLSETLKTWKANSHLPSHCPPRLTANGQLFHVPNYPRLGLQDQIKFPRISQLEYFRGHQKHTPSQRQSFRNPAGTLIGQICVFMHVPPSALELNDNLTTNKWICASSLANHNKSTKSKKWLFLGDRSKNKTRFKTQSSLLAGCAHGWAKKS